MRKAALDLSITPSSVSRRLSVLESFLGRQLFERTDFGLQLTEAGKRYLSAIAPAVEALRRASSPGELEESRIVVATSHSMANRWLAPRIGDLRAKTGLTMEILPTRDADSIRSGRAQFGIWGALRAPDLKSDLLIQTPARPIFRPCLADDRVPPKTLEALAEYPLLSVSDPADIWHRWFAAAGLKHEPSNVIEFATMSLMYEAALGGIGVALAIPMLCENALESGSLVFCGPSLPIGESYRLFRQPRRGCESISERSFVRWIKRETQLSSRLFDEFAVAA